MEEKSAKRFICNVAGLTALTGATALMLLYILDPFQIFHVSYFAQDKFIKGYERYQNAGVIHRMTERGDCCEVAIIGTSLSQNFLPSYVSKNFGATGTLQISLPGSLPLEQKTLHEHASRNGEIKYVVWDIHNLYAEKTVIPINSEEILKTSPGKYFPLNLYDNFLFNDYYSLASLDMVSHFVRLITKGSSYETYQSWYAENAPSFGRGKEIASKHPDVSLKKIPKDIGSRYYEFPHIEILLSAIEKHPEQEFYIYIPPYSRHYYAIMSQEQYEQNMAMRYILARELQAYSNARLFVFDELFATIDDLNDYKDISHYSEETSKRIIDYMAAGEGILNAEDMEEHLQRVTEKVNRYVRKFQTQGYDQ